MDKKEVVVSVIVPVYNVERYLEKCVDSIMRQTYKKIEIILVDDGSTDKSGMICDKLALMDSRIRVIHKSNGGLSDARNVGLDICTGEYVSFIDSDDYISEYFYEIFMNIFLDKNCDIITLKRGTDFWSGESIPDLAKNNTDYRVSYMTSQKALEMMLYQNIVTGVPFKVCRKKVWNNIRFPYGYLYEDVATTYKLFLESENCAVVEGDLYAYRRRKDSIIRQDFSEKKMVCLKIFDQLISDSNLIDCGLKLAAESRAYAMTYSVFLQVPSKDKEIKEKIWKKLKLVQKDIMFDKSPMVRRKNKYAAWISFIFGMEISYYIGRKFGQKGSMKG